VDREVDLLENGLEDTLVYPKRAMSLKNFFFLLLLADNSSTGQKDKLWHLRMCLEYILIINPLYCSLTPTLLLEQFQQVSLFYFHIWIQSTSVIIRLTPSIILPHSSLSHFLGQFQQVSLFYFQTWIQNTSTIFTLLNPFLMPFHWYAPLERTCFTFFPVFHFLKLYIDRPRGVHIGISNMYISCFNQINPLILTLCLSLCSPIIQQLTVHWFMLS
jgi:hypothetical protein